MSSGIFYLFTINTRIVQIIVNYFSICRFRKYLFQFVSINREKQKTRIDFLREPLVSLNANRGFHLPSNAAKNSIGVFEAKLMATRASAAVSILRNSRVLSSPALAVPRTSLSQAVWSVHRPKTTERLRTGENSRAMVRRVVSYSAGLFTRGRDEILHPYGNGFILENFCKFVPLESLKRIPWIRWIENLAGATAGLSKWDTFFGNYIRCASSAEWTALTLNKDQKGGMKAFLIVEERKFSRSRELGQKYLIALMHF